MKKAVAAYLNELEKPEGERVGSRTICSRFMQQHKDETGEVLPLNHTTLMRLAAGGRSQSEANAENCWFTRRRR